MHSSRFSYTLARPYPYKWFTPVAVIGTLIFVAVFTVINFASSGYNLTVIYSHNPNRTTSQTLFGQWPSLLASKVIPTCQPAIVPVNTQFYTNNTALQYTLTNVRDQDGNNLPSLIYYNNQLQDCKVLLLQLILDLAGRTATQFGMSEWGVDAQAQVSCKAPLESSAGGMVTVNLTADYNFVPPTVTEFTGTFKFRGRDPERAASLYWGESLLSMYYVQLILAMKFATIYASLSNGTVQGLINNVATFTYSGNTSDIASLDYFDVGWRGIAPESLFNYTSHYLLNNRTVSWLDSNEWYPNIWIPADTMAKSFESTILTDLGQATAQPNILTSAELLQQFTANFSQIMDYAYVNYVPLIDVNNTIRPLDVGPVVHDYRTSKDVTGPLGVNNSTIAANYLCSVPKKKPTGDLLVSLTVADLVFLQAAWLVFTFAVCFMLKRRDSTADYCEGCARSARPEDRHALLQPQPQPQLQPRPNKRSSYELLDVPHKNLSRLFRVR